MSLTRTPEPQRRASPRQAAKAGTVEQVIADLTVEAVAICSPTDTHADLIERAVKAGKATFLREACRSVRSARARVA